MGVHDRLKVLMNMVHIIWSIMNHCLNFVINPFILGWIMILTTISMQMIMLQKICSLYLFGVQVGFKLIKICLSIKIFDSDVILNVFLNRHNSALIKSTSFVSRALEEGFGDRLRQVRVNLGRQETLLQPF